MITLTEEQAHQIEEALHNVGNALMCLTTTRKLRQMYQEMRDDAVDGCNKALSTIRAARTQKQAEQAPVAFHRASFLSGYEAAQYDANSCDVPPQGWLCTRQAGHDGPCAAIEDNNGRELVNRAMSRLAEQDSAPQPMQDQVVTDEERMTHAYRRGFIHGQVDMRDRDESEPVKQEPVAWKCACGANLYIDSNGAPASKAEQAEPEPVAKVVLNRTNQITMQKPNGDCFDVSKHVGDFFYAAPVRTKDLTDDEAQKLWNDTSSIVPMWAHHLHFARAVIAKFKEKNI